MLLRIPCHWSTWSLPHRDLQGTANPSWRHLKTGLEAPLYLLSAVQASIQRNSGPLRSKICKMQNEFFQFGPQFTPAMTRDLEDCSLTVDGQILYSPSISKWNLQLVVLCFVKPAVHEAIGSNIAGRWWLGKKHNGSKIWPRPVSGWTSTVLGLGRANLRCKAWNIINEAMVDVDLYRWRLYKLLPKTKTANRPVGPVNASLRASKWNEFSGAAHLDCPTGKLMSCPPFFLWHLVLTLNLAVPKLIRDWDSAIPDRCTTNSTSTQELRSGSMGKKGTTLATSRYGSDRPMCQVFGLPTLSAHRKTPKPSSLKSSRLARSCWIYVCRILCIRVYIYIHT